MFLIGFKTQKFPLHKVVRARFLKGLRRDAQFIREKITSQFKPQRRELVVRDIAIPQRGDKVLIVADLGRHGELSNGTEELIKANESRQKGEKGFITITHPDSEDLNTIMGQIQSRESDKVIRSGITAIPFEQIDQALDTHQRIFITTPMGKNPEADCKIVDVWQQHSNPDNVLVHTRGRSFYKGKSIQPWAGALLRNYIGPEEIDNAMEERAQTNKKVREVADNVYKTCAQIRSEGKSPKFEITNNNPDILNF